MIKLFRKIRQNLISKTNTGKFLQYAIVEIILVVIGILIAIQLDDLKDRADKKKQEIVYLKNILTDLKQDQSELLKIIERRKSKSKSAKIMEGYYHTNEVNDLKGYYSHWTNVLYWEAHHPSLITFKELVNSGKLSTLTNEKVKQLLLQIDYNYNELFEVRKHMYDDYSEYLYSPFADIIDYEKAIIAWAEPDTIIKLSRVDVGTALKSKRIKNGFTLARFNNDLLIERLATVLVKIDSTIVIVEKEIKK
jgi:hypothetical protein